MKSTVSAHADVVCLVRLQFSLPRKASFMEKTGPGLLVEEGQVNENLGPRPLRRQLEVILQLPGPRPQHLSYTVCLVPLAAPLPPQTGSRAE